MHLTYASLFQIKDLLKCTIGLPASRSRANVFTSRSLISASSLFNDQPSSPTLLSQGAMEVISNAGGPTRLWRRIPAFRSVSELINWEKGSNWSPAVACQGNEGAAEAHTVPLHSGLCFKCSCQHTVWSHLVGAEAASWALPSASRPLQERVFKLLGEWQLSLLCLWEIVVMC